MLWVEISALLLYNDENKLINAAEYLDNVGIDSEVIEKLLNDESIIFKYAC